MKFLSNLGQKSVLVWSFFVFGLLSLSSLLIRTLLPMDGSEMSYFQPNGILFFLALILFFVSLALLVYLSRFLKTSHLFLIGSLVYLLFGLYLIMHQNDVIRHDSLAVLEGAKAMNQGDFSQLTSWSGYLHRFPHQLGLVSFERIILAIFGLHNVKIFFWINLLMVIADNFFLWKITDNVFKSDRVSKIEIILSFLFLPGLFFILFVYGLTYGLFFAIVGLYFLQRFLEKRAWTNLVLSVLFLGVSDVIRSNYSILILTVLIVLLLDFLRSKSRKTIIFVLSLILSVVVMNRAVSWYYKGTANTNKIEGEPKIAWVAMGLDDKSKIYNRVSGWYDGYLENVYVQYKGNSKKIEDDSHKLITKRLKIMRNNPSYGFNFFKDKFISTWTDSLFQSIWSGPVIKMQVENQKISGKLMSSIYESGLAYRIIYYFSALLLVLIYVAVFPFLISQWKSTKKGDGNLFLLVPLIYLSGGVIFHLIWETKSQYVYPYVYLLLPLSAFGLFLIFSRLGKYVGNVLKRNNG